MWFSRKTSGLAVYSILVVTCATSFPKTFLHSDVEQTMRMDNYQWRKPVKWRYPEARLAVIHPKAKQHLSSLQKQATQATKHQMKITHIKDHPEVKPSVVHAKIEKPERLLNAPSGLKPAVSKNTDIKNLTHTMSASTALLKNRAVNSPNNYHLYYFIFFVILVCGLGGVLCFGTDILETARQETQGAQTYSRGPEKKDPQSTNTKPKPAGPAKYDSMIQTANTKANLVKLEVEEDVQGTWVKTYRNADMTSREALELLFRCNIIPHDEFAQSFVSQEHIDECVWISTQMLRQRSLDEWVVDWQTATKTFQESVTACFAARTDVLASLYGNDSEPNTPGSTTPDLRLYAPRTTSTSPNVASPNIRETSPASDRGVMDCRTPGNPSPNHPSQSHSGASSANVPPRGSGSSPTAPLSEVSFSGNHSAQTYSRRPVYGSSSDVTLRGSRPESSYSPPQTRQVLSHGNSPLAPHGLSPPQTRHDLPSGVLSRLRENPAMQDYTPASSQQSLYK